MRIAFFGLGYHAKTGSSRFFLDLLRAEARVDAYFAEADVADVRRRCAGFAEDAYDAIVIWQLHEAFALLSGRHPNVTFAPMHDAMFRGGAFAWKPSFNAAKILCFSWALRAEVMRRAPVHAHVQYFPDPAPHRPVGDFDTLRGFFWYRRRDIPPEAVFAMTAGTRFASLAVHDAPDPGHEAPWPDAVPPHLGTLTRTTWSEDRAAFDAALGGANVFFASRPLEGIGMSFLEAMASGLCVVAPDAPTMNEVISHGTNGLLHPPGSCAPLDFAAARDLGARARESVARGRRRFEEAVPGLMEFVSTPTAALARRAGSRGVLLPATVDAPLPDVGIVRDGALPDASWTLLLTGRDSIADSVALAQALESAPTDAVAIRGHHLLRAKDGTERLCRTAELDAGWARLLRGEEAIAGLGVPAATLLRTSLLRRFGVAPPATPAALCDLLLRARAEGGAVIDADRILAIHAEPEDAAAERAEWSARVGRREGAPAAQHLQAARAAADAGAEARARGGRAARFALGLVARVDALSPALARAVEALLLGGTLRRLRALLARRPPVGAP